MAESNKRAADQAADEQHLQKRAKTTFEPFPYDPKPGAINAFNLADSFPELKASTQSADLTQAAFFIRVDRRKFADRYIVWQNAKSFTLADEHFLRNNESLAPQVKTTVSKWDIATRALTTFHDIFAMAVKDKTDAQLALTAAHKVIDYAIICYMTAGPYLARIDQNFRELGPYFEAAISYIESIPPRATVNFFGTQAPEPGYKMSALQYRDNIFQNIPASTTADLTAASPPPSILGFSTPAARNNGTMQAPLPPPSNLGTSNTTRSALTAGGRITNAEDVIANVQQCILDTKNCLPWNEVHACPAIKLLLRVYFNRSRKNEVAKVEGIKTNGLLLFGRPGTGKTILVQAMAGEFGYTVYQLSMADVNSKWQGDSEKFVTTLFEQALANQPAMILIDEIDALTRTRASSDTGSTSAIKSIFSACWAALEQHHHQVVVVGTSSIPDQIDDGFLRRLTTKIWVRGPEGPERFAIAKSKLARVYHDIDLEPTPLTSHGTTSLYGFLTKVDKNNAIAKLTGAEIAHAIREAVCMAEMDLDDTEVWTKATVKGEELLVPKTYAITSKGHGEEYTLTKPYSAFTEEELNQVTHRPVNISDIRDAIGRIRVSGKQNMSHLTEWDCMNGTSLYHAKAKLGLGEDYNY